MIKTGASSWHVLRTGRETGKHEVNVITDVPPCPAPARGSTKTHAVHILHVHSPPCAPCPPPAPNLPAKQPSSFGLSQALSLRMENSDKEQGQEKSGSNSLFGLGRRPCQMLPASFVLKGKVRFILTESGLCSCKYSFLPVNASKPARVS